MILCKYFDLKGIDVLCNLRLKVADPLTFNDPFEFSSYVDGKIKFSDFKRFYKHPATLDRWYRGYSHVVGARNKHEFKQIMRGKDKELIYNKMEPNIVANFNEELEKLRLTFANDCRVLCFSDHNEIEPYEEILMWSHYSNSHEGVKILFDIEKFKLRSTGPVKVTYHKERTRLDATRIMFNDKEVFDDFGKSLIAKSIVWSYEHEYRWFISIKECFSEIDNGLKHDFIKISPEAIVGVDLGIRCPVERIDEITEILRSDELKHVDLRRATLDEKKFKLNFNK